MCIIKLKYRSKEDPNNLEKLLRDNKVKISVISDSHLLPRDMISHNHEFIKALGADRKLFTESEALLRGALDLIEKNDSDIIFITGDLTKDGEYLGHEKFIEIFQEYKNRRPGRYVFPIFGNHDINSNKAYDYNYQSLEITRKTPSAKPGDLIDLYGDLFYKEAIEKYKDSSIFASYLEEVNSKYKRKSGSEYFAQGYTSYVSRVDIGDNKGTCGVTIIGLDTLQYSVDATDSQRDDINEPNGSISLPLLKWTLDKAQEARSRNDVIIALAHHGFIPHFYNQDVYLKPYIIKNWNKRFTNGDHRLMGKTIAEAFADNGISVIFTGHMHAQDIAKMNTINDNSFYDIETGSVVTYPLPVRHIVLTNNLESEKSNYTFDISSEFIKNFSYKNLDDNEVTVINGQDYSSRYLITGDLVAGLVEYVLKNITLAKKTSKDLAIEELSKRITGLGKNNFNTLIKFYLRSILGTKKKPKISAKLKPVKFFGVPTVNIYFGKIENEQKYGKGNKVGIDIIIGDELYPFMIRGKNLMKIIDNIFEQIDGKFLRDTEVVYKWTRRLANSILFHEILKDKNEIKTISDVINYSYLSHLKGEERQPQWITDAIELFEKENIIEKILLKDVKDVTDELIPDVFGRILYIPNIKEVLEYDGLSKKLSIKKRQIRRLIRKFAGKDLYDTLKNIGYKRSKAMVLILEDQKVQEMIMLLNKRLASVINSFTNENIPEYRNFSYDEDNNTFIEIFFKEENGGGLISREEKFPLASSIDSNFR